MHKPQQIEAGVNMKVGYGSADLSAGNINADVRVQMGSAKEATDAVAKFNGQLEEVKKSGQLPPQAVGMLGGVKIAAAGDEMQVKCSLKEADVMGLMQMALGQ